MYVLAAAKRFTSGFWLPFSTGMCRWEIIQSSPGRVGSRLAWAKPVGMVEDLPAITAEDLPEKYLLSYEEASYDN